MGLLKNKKNKNDSNTQLDQDIDSFNDDEKENKQIPTDKKKIGFKKNKEKKVKTKKVNKKNIEDKQPNQNNNTFDV